jgi:hypothetical protein
LYSRGQDATLRRAKDDLNLKENKYLTEEAKNPYGRLQPTTSKKIEAKEKKQQQRSHRNARFKHKQLTLASSHIYIQKEKATQNSPKLDFNSIVDSEISLSPRLGYRIRRQKNETRLIFAKTHVNTTSFATTDCYTYGDSAGCKKNTKHCIAGDKMLPSGGQRTI